MITNSCTANTPKIDKMSDTSNNAYGMFTHTRRIEQATETRRQCRNHCQINVIRVSPFEKSVCLILLDKRKTTYMNCMSEHVSCVSFVRWFCCCVLGTLFAYRHRHEKRADKIDQAHKVYFQAFYLISVRKLALLWHFTPGRIHTHTHWNCNIDTPNPRPTNANFCCNHRSNYSNQNCLQD